jgi:hypothetical protein
VLAFGRPCVDPWSNATDGVAGSILYDLAANTVGLFSAARFIYDPALAWSDAGDRALFAVVLIVAV